MRNLVLVVATVGALALAGCANHDQQEDARCKSFGYSPGTSQYGACRQFLYAERLKEAQAMMAVGSAMMQRSQPSTTTYTFDGRIINCTRVGNIVNCN